MPASREMAITVSDAALCSHSPQKQLHYQMQEK